jgi:DNA polymerase-3 subunit epsilon
MVVAKKNNQREGFLCRTDLKKQRLKPAQDQKPAKIVTNRNSGEPIELFDPALCVAMRPYKAPSEAQAAALARGRFIRDSISCKSCDERFYDYDLLRGRCAACDVKVRMANVKKQVTVEVPERTVYLDFETTGLYDAEVVEVAIIDDSGAVLLHSLVKPVGCTEWPEAQAIHGITPADVADAPVFADLLPRIELIISECSALVIYNQDFDLGFIGARDSQVRKLASDRARCAMLAWSEYVGEWNNYYGDYRWHKLFAAAEAVDHDWSGDAHRALADVLAARSVWKHLISL